MAHRLKTQLPYKFSQAETICAKVLQSHIIIFLIDNNALNLFFNKLTVGV
jgi:hypothetical protein